MKKSEQREATIQKLIEIGREIFTQQGYAQAATEEIVQRAGVTRGALYHHFGSKEGLFKAVLDDVQREIATRITASAAQIRQDSWGQLLAGCKVFLSASLDPQVRQIVLIDAPAVLGWEVWRKTDEATSMQGLYEILAILMREGRIKPLPLAALVHLLSGAMNEAALWIAQADDPDQALDESIATLETLLGGIKIE